MKSNFMLKALILVKASGANYTVCSNLLTLWVQSATLTLNTARHTLYALYY